VTKEWLSALQAKADSSRLSRSDVQDLFGEVASLREHNQVLADELNDWRDQCADLRAANARQAEAIAELRKVLTDVKHWAQVGATPDASNMSRLDALRTCIGVVNAALELAALSTPKDPSGKETK